MGGRGGGDGPTASAAPQRARTDQLHLVMKPTTRRATLAQEELPRDLSVLRTAAQAHGRCLGVYASMRSPGVVNVGDPVGLL
jgi:hypothetical protein